MISCDFKTTAYGKWILAGEHAVLRGGSAIVFPVKEKRLILSYCQSSSTLSAEYSRESGAELLLLFWSVLEQGIQQLGLSVNSLKGKFSLFTDIPLSVGMGASAALCVAMTRWFISQQLLSSDKLYTFARTLENLFHGQSSGLDIAGVVAEKGICFQKNHSEPVKLAWTPTWFLSTCEQPGITSHCIQRVHFLWANNLQLAEKIDTKMKAAVWDAKDALEHHTEHAFDKLALAIRHSAECFIAWGLVSGSLYRHMQHLKAHGAVAVKPTGSGGGGYVVSLWNKHPPQSIINELIAV